MAEEQQSGAGFIARQWLPKLVKKLTRSSEDRKHEFDAICLEFPDPRELARYYVEPDCQRVNPANALDGTIEQARTPAFEAMEAFLAKPTLERDGSAHLLVLGDAGMGKSSLLLITWAMHLYGYWSQDLDCTLLKLGPDSLDAIAAIPTPSRHVLLLDALDEDASVPATTRGAMLRLKALIDATLGFHKVVISCRTQFFIDEDENPSYARLGHARIDGYTCPLTYLSPFDDEQAKQLIRKRFPNNWRHYLLMRANDPRDKALELAQTMGELRMRPLLLSYIPFLVDEGLRRGGLDLGLPDREYEVYRLMITRWLDREELKMRAYSPTSETRSQRLREVCWQVATFMKLDGTRKMSRADFDILKERLGVREFLADSTLEGRALLNKDSAGYFRFAHSSIQEFLIVEHCLTRGAFRPSAGMEHRLEPNALMLNFYTQRLQARSPARDTSVRFMGAGDPYGYMFRDAALAPAVVLSLAKLVVRALEAQPPPEQPFSFARFPRGTSVVPSVVLATFAVMCSMSDSWKLSGAYSKELPSDESIACFWGIDAEEVLAVGQMLASPTSAGRSAKVQLFAQLEALARASKDRNLEINIHRARRPKPNMPEPTSGASFRAHDAIRAINSMIQTLRGALGERPAQWGRIEELAEDLELPTFDRILDRLTEAIETCVLGLAAGMFNLGLDEVTLEGLYREGLEAAMLAPPR